MSQQDRTSDIVINHQTIKQVVDWLLVPALFAGMQIRAGAKWKPRMLAVAALLWACSDSVNLKDRFAVARKIVERIFRWEDGAFRFQRTCSSRRDVGGIAGKLTDYRRCGLRRLPLLEDHPGRATSLSGSCRRQRVVC